MSDSMPRQADYEARYQMNPFKDETAVIQPVGALISVEQQRAVAEVQARMIIARSNPRNTNTAVDLILQDCQRPTLAAEAQYWYSRGGSIINGASIRLAESIARRWGNIASGIKEISRDDGYSECIAYAWDLETGYYDERQFQVRHWRDTKQGGRPLRDERDIYELIANMGQRRKRAVLLTVIPSDVTDAAMEQCEKTLLANVDLSPDAMQRLAESFAIYGVTKEHIEKRCQVKFGAIRRAQVVQLRKIYVSIKDGISDADQWFPGAEMRERPRDQPRRQPVQQTQTEQQKQPDQSERQGQQEATVNQGENREQKQPDSTQTTESQQASFGPTIILDCEGEPETDDEEYTDPQVYARKVVSIWVGYSEPDRAAFLEYNETGIEEARAYAGDILKQLDQENVPQTVAAVEVIVSRGQPSYGGYLKDLEAAGAATPSHMVERWIEAQRDVVTKLPFAQRTQAIKRLTQTAARAKLGLPRWASDALIREAKPAAEGEQTTTAGTAEDPDQAWVDRQIRELEKIEQMRPLSAARDAYKALLGPDEVRERFSAMKERNPEQYGRLQVASTKTYQALAGGTKP